MPQMAPISWLSLFLIFSLAFIIFNMINYFFFIPNSNKLNNMKKINLNSMNWKW
uniref:ATP synthase complex subunit 8 n=1 Tax=Hydrellia tritici TaxID=504561 RepID=B2L9C5_9MUSC|nr:ATPase 8 [Hydrellia tritici]